MCKLKFVIGCILVSLGVTVAPATHNQIWLTNAHKDIMCLADNIYHEARGESYLGKLLVANVTINRVKSKYWPGSICEVVHQYKQFSWTLATKVKSVNIKEYAEAKKIAVEAMTISRVTDATYFHATRIKPKWAKYCKKLATVGNHIFYKEC